MDIITEKALFDTSDSFRQFSRNGKWGTCCECPRDRENHAYPEYCQHKDRYDHELDVDALSKNWKTYVEHHAYLESSSRFKKIQE